MNSTYILVHLLIITSVRYTQVVVSISIVIFFFGHLLLSDCVTSLFTHSINGQMNHFHYSFFFCIHYSFYKNIYWSLGSVIDLQYRVDFRCIAK